MTRRTLIQLIKIAENVTAAGSIASAPAASSPGVSVPSQGEHEEKRRKKTIKPVKK